MMIAKPQRVMLLMTLSLITACNAGEPSRPVVETQTNEQGCVRVRSTGPQYPAAVPVPIKQACVGPYLVELPQNYFYNQMGTEFDGSFALALEYPSLEPFKPGERSNLPLGVSVRTVRIDYSFIDRIEIEQALRNNYEPMELERGDPAASVTERLPGKPVFGLTPYYADMNRIRQYWRSRGLSEDAPGMQDRWHTDWYISRSAEDAVQTIVKCTSRGAAGSGVGFHDGELGRNSDPYIAECDHTFAVSDHRTIVRINYPRMALGDWRRIEDRARNLYLDNIIKW